MERTRIVVTTLVVLLLAAGDLGCYAHRTHDASTFPPPADATHLAEVNQRISGYSTTDGRYHAVNGWVKAVPGDSLEFRVERHTPGSKASQGISEPRRVPAPPDALSSWRTARSDVVSIDAVSIDPVGTVVVIALVTALLGLILIGVAVATKESCPFVYSWDGTRYVFDGEPYGGATMQSLERTDWSELEHLVAADGEYRLMLTNEVDETQHTNSLALLVVDHPAGTRVVMDREGRPHAFRDLVPLESARDERGRDLLRWLREDDRLFWYPRLDELAKEDSLVDTRNHLTLRFRRPPGDGPVWLVSSAATGQWGSHQIRSMLGMRGDRVDEFYAAINGSDEYRRQLYDWNAREELFELFPEVRVGERWERTDFIPGGGPFLHESRAIPLGALDASRKDVEIRLHPPIGFWSLNAFHLASAEESLHVTRVLPRTVVDQDGRDVRALLLADDDARLDFPTRQERATLVFDAPPPNGGVRAVFAETRGWYQVHLHQPGPPDVAGITRMTLEPGYVVRRAMHEYTRYRQTGVLTGTLADSTGGR